MCGPLFNVLKFAFIIVLGWSLATWLRLVSRLSHSRYTPALASQIAGSDSTYHHARLASITLLTLSPNNCLSICYARYCPCHLGKQNILVLSARGTQAIYSEGMHKQDC